MNSSSKMRLLRSSIAAVAISIPPIATGQEPPKSAPAKPAAAPTSQTQKSARTFNFNVPAPRGQIAAADGTTLASSSMDGSIKLWAPHTGVRVGAKLGMVDLQRAKMMCVAVAPDGTTIVSVPADLASDYIMSALTVWSRAGTCLRVLNGHLHQVLSVCFSPNGKIIASSSWDGAIKLWNSATGACLHTLPDNKGLPSRGPVTSVVFSPDGSKLISSTYQEKSASLWDVSKFTDE